MPSLDESTSARQWTAALRELGEDYVRHGASPGNLGFWLLALYRFGRFADGLPAPARALGSKVYGVLLTAEELFCGAVLERKTEIGEGFTLLEADGVRIWPKTVIGKRVSVMHGVTIGPSASRPGTPVIGDDVFIGAGAKIFGPVHVGDGARIEANALVVSDVPPGMVVSGVPARVIGKRTPAERRDSA